MLKKILFTALFALTNISFAEESLPLIKASLDQLKPFNFVEHQGIKKALISKNAPENSLEKVKVSQEANQVITRYQQRYKGIPVIGAEAIIIKSTSKSLTGKRTTIVNGQLIKNIEINIVPTLNSSEAFMKAKEVYSHLAKTNDEQSELQLRKDSQDHLQLVYLVSFKTEIDTKPKWPFFVVDAHTGEILTRWDNIKHFETGPGGNEKTQEYWYGKDNNPSLDFQQNGTNCLMKNNRVQLVHLNFREDWYNKNLTPYSYECGNNTEEFINGSYSAMNDAFYFGNVIDDMYKEWYGIPVLQDANGHNLPLIMRVHFGKNFENAFWDGRVMSFGDGDRNFYSLVSLDVAAHEITHGFTEFHSNLEYHDQPGALNESLSDMAGIASKAYLLEKEPNFYSKIYNNDKKVSFAIGDSIVKPTFGRTALRFMDKPSTDGLSTDCYQRDLAETYGETCMIDYATLIDFAEKNIEDPEDRQGLIVHSASGVFNKAFTLLAEDLGIKKAYELMIVANSHYLTPTSDFENAACGMLNAAKDMQVDLNTVRNAFNKVGVPTTTCTFEK